MNLLRKIFLSSGFVAIALSFFPLPSISQLAVNNGAPYNDPSYLVQNILLNPGATISNVTFNGQTGIPTGSNAQMIGYFDGTNSNIGIMNGVVLVSGPISGAVGPNNSPSFGTDNGTPGDVYLDAASGRTTYNAAVLEFDFTSASDKVSLRYVFASEEYDEWVCTSYNDVFAFFVSGPGIAGEINIALIPSTNTLVAINSVNNGTVGSNGSAADCISLSYSQYFVDNGDGYTPGANPTVQFDGFTISLIAMSPTLIPCETYHMKIAIADASDGIYDSGVFLEMVNFPPPNGNQVHVADMQTFNTNITEGCDTVNFIFSRDSSSAPLTLYFTVSGTAINGTDYSFLPDSVVFSAGQLTITLPLVAYYDSINENLETIIVTVPTDSDNSPCGTSFPSVAQINIVNTLPLSLTTGGDTIICPGDSINISVNPMNGNPPYGILWNNGSQNTSLIIAPDTTTFYYVAVTDKCGTDTITGQVNVTVNNIPMADSVITTPDTCSNQYGTAVIVLNGGTPPFTYQWSAVGTGSSAVNLLSGQYGVTVTDYRSCSKSIGFYIPDFSTGLLIDSIIKNDEASCMAGDGSIAAMVSGGIGAYTFLWSNGGTDSSIDSLYPGVYSVKVEDYYGCTDSAFALVNHDGLPVISISNIENETCFENNDGSATASLAGGMSPVTYAWSTNPVKYGATANGLSAGSYYVTATDDSGCKSVTMVEISQPDSLILTLLFLQNVSCYGGSDGAAQVQVKGGTPPYSYAWSSDFIEDTFPYNGGLTAGYYFVDLNDLNWCYAFLDVDISQPPEIIINFLKKDLICYGNNNGEISVHASMGLSPYMYLWSNGSNDTLLTGLVSGIYSVTVTDTGNCMSDTSITIYQPPELSIYNLIIQPEVDNSNNGRISFTVTGGTQPFSYNWSPNIGPGGNVAINLDAGIYYVTITDNNSCELIDSFIVPSTSAIIELGIPIGFNLSPNPSGGVFSLTVENADNDDYSIRFSDILGKIIFTGQIYETGFVEKNYDFSSFEGGVYLLTLTNNSGVFTRKIIIVK